MNSKLSILVLLVLTVVGCGGGGGTSSGSAQSSSSPLRAPEKPQDVSITTNSGQAFLQWSASQRADSYSIYVLDSLITNLSDAKLIDGSVTGNRYTVSDLDDGGVYYFAVVAANSAGESPASDTAVALISGVNDENQFSATLSSDVFVVKTSNVEEFHSRIISVLPEEIVFDGSVGGFEVGDIILSPSDKSQFPSIFSKVLGISEESGTTVFRVEPASLSEAFYNLRAQGSFSVDLSNLPASHSIDHANVDIYSSPVAPLGVRNNCGTQRDYIVGLRLGNSMSGCMSMTARFDFDVTVESGGDPDWNSVFTIDSDISLDLTSGEGVDFAIDQPLLPDGFTLPPFVVGLLAFENRLNFIAGVTSSVGGIPSMGFDSSSNTVVGLSYDGGGWSPVTDSSATYNVSPPNVYNDLAASLRVGPHFQSMIYGLVGPEVSVASGLDLSGSRWSGGSSLSADYVVGADIDLGFGDSVPGISDLLSNLFGYVSSGGAGYSFPNNEILNYSAFYDDKLDGEVSSSSVSSSLSSSSSISSSSSYSSSSSVVATSSSSSSSYSSSSSSVATTSSSSSSLSSSSSTSSVDSSSSVSSSESSSSSAGSSWSSSSVSSQDSNWGAPDPTACNASYDVITSGLPAVLGAFGENSDMTQIDIPSDQTILSKRFVSPSDMYVTGQVNLGATATATGATFNIWFSDCAGGEPLDIAGSACARQGSFVSLRWSNPGLRTSCEIGINETRYFNVQVVSGGESCPGSGSCGVYIQHRFSR